MPLPDVVVRIFDDAEGVREMPPGEVGEIAFSAPQLMTGFWNRPDETSAVLRDHVDEMLDLFDFAEPSLVVAAREVTTVPSQALFMLNSPFVQENAAALAKRFQGTSADPKERITAAYFTALSRPPTAAEVARAETYLKTQATQRGQTPESAMTTFCQSLFASAEFRYLK